MKEFNVHSVVATYSVIAKLKENKDFCGNQVAATQIFGAQQIAILYWSEGEIVFDLGKVIAILAFHQIKSVEYPFYIANLRKEFWENQTVEANIAHFCVDLENELQLAGLESYSENIRLIKKKYYDLMYEANVSDENFKQLCDAMTEWINTTDFTPVSTKIVQFIKKYYPEFLIRIEDINRILARYCVLNELKYKVRMGWNYWNVNTSHREVVSEHVFGTQPLAYLMYWYGSEGRINYNKIVFMMAIHESEESIMPDFTPYDPVTGEQMLEMGKKSVAVLFGGLKRGQKLIELLDEFNAHETMNSKFAYFCDKLECLFRVKRYTDLGLCTFEGGQDIVKNDPKIKQSIQKGAKTVADFFIMDIMPKYTSDKLGADFAQVSDFLKTYDTSK